MIKIDGIKLGLSETDAELSKKVNKLTKIQIICMKSFEIIRKMILLLRKQEDKGICRKDMLLKKEKESMRLEML